ncbi:MAG TPA: hypothetical protein VKB38_19860 [Terracidiphilus sp.]|nr:hypothetical protein [Terracidiphilus sp.]
MKQILITRNNNVVSFQTVNIDNTEMVFFTNKDTQEAHWPTIITNQLGPAPSPNSSQYAPSGSATPPFVVNYGCQIKGHESEAGVINVFAALGPTQNTTLPNATVNVPVQVAIVTGGASPYQISGQLFQVVDSAGNIIQQGSNSVGPGLSLTPSNDNSGITLGGAPTVVGTYQFTFNVTDNTDGNLQGIQFSMAVSPA